MMKRRIALVILGSLLFYSSTAANAADGKPAVVQVEGLVSGIKVLPAATPDCSSLKSLVESVARGCKTNDEQAITLYNFMRLTHYHRAYPSEPGGIPVLKAINCYGWTVHVQLPPRPEIRLEIDTYQNR